MSLRTRPSRWRRSWIGRPFLVSHHAGLAIDAERRMIRVMDVELLVVRECSNEASAARLLRTALDDIGLPYKEFDTTVVGSRRDAERLGFTGSPSFYVDGCDQFREPGRPASL